MSGRYKRELMTYLLFDYEGIEEHLEKMAAKGWFLETPGNTIWKYREGEPAKVKYAVTYVPQASQFDPEPVAEQKTLEEFCAEAGWQKVGDFLQAQIYMNRNPGAVPLETEDAVRLEVIREAMQKSFVPANVVLTLLMIWNLWRGTNNFFDNPLSYLSGYGSLLSTAFLPIGAALVSANLIAYFVWLNRSAKSVASGGRCVSPRLVRLLNQWQLPVIGLYFIGMVVGIAGEGNVEAARYMVFYMIGFFGLVSLLNFTKNFMKKRKASRGTNIAVFVIVDIIAAFTMVAVVMWLAFSMDWGDAGSDAGNPYAPEVHETFLVKQTSGELESPNVGYEVNEIKAEMLFDWCLEKRVLQETYRGIYTETPDTAWNVDRCYYRSLGSWEEWLLVKDNCIIEIQNREPLTAEQKKIILQQLGL